MPTKDKVIKSVEFDKPVSSIIEPVLTDNKVTLKYTAKGYIPEEYSKDMAHINSYVLDLLFLAVTDTLNEAIKPVRKSDYKEIKSAKDYLIFINEKDSHLCGQTEFINSKAQDTFPEGTGVLAMVRDKPLKVYYNKIGVYPSKDGEKDLVLLSLRFEFDITELYLEFIKL